MLRVNHKWDSCALRNPQHVEYHPVLHCVQKNRMTAENEPRHEHSASHEAIGDQSETLALSLTDLIDEMDRAAFLRSLSSRHPKRPLEIDFSELRARPKRS